MPFREMRRKNQALSQEQCVAALLRGTSGVLAVAGDDGYPYAVPLSYAYADGTLFFHCASAGHKLDAIARCDKASFCVIDRDDVAPESFTTHFASVIVFGRVRVVEESGEKRAALRALAARYSPGREAAGDAEIDRLWDRTRVLALRVEHMSGKRARELAADRRG